MHPRVVFQKNYILKLSHRLGLIADIREHSTNIHFVNKMVLGNKHGYYFSNFWYNV
jgi:hypothetical protein